jgi:uncharacterized Zn finger protein (UPF0148 family)
MQMSYCRIHGYYSELADGCPSCQQVEEANQQRLDNIADRLGGAWDLGDYVCPHCHYKTLRRNAPLCPLCKTEPGWRLWRRIDSEERERRIAAEEAAVAEAERKRLRKIQQAEEWEREAPARAAAAHSQAAAARRQGASQRAEKFVLFYMGYFGPMLLFAIPTYMVGAQNRAGGTGSCAIFFPVLNWLLLPHALYFVLFDRPFWYPLVGLLACGVVALALWALLRAVYSVTLTWLVGGVVVVITILLVMGRSFATLGGG